MAREYSFKTEVERGDKCFISDDRGITWINGKCQGISANLINGVVDLSYDLISENGCDCIYAGTEVASRELFLEWQSRLIEVADSHKFKGDKDKMFGESNFSQWIPFYKEGLSPGTGDMVGMGLIDREAIGDE